MDWVSVPKAGVLAGVTNVKIPATLNPLSLTAVPLMVEVERLCPAAMLVAVMPLRSGVPLAITKAAIWLVVPKALLADRVAVLVPAAVGVPLISPLVAMFRSVGRLVAPNVIGAVPLAVTEYSSGTPTVPIRVEGVVITGGVPEIMANEW
jgi:hypothetical protein